MLVLAMQFSRDGARPEASGSAPDRRRGTGAELDGNTGDHAHFPEGRRHADHTAGVRETPSQQSSEARPHGSLGGARPVTAPP
jgi:hypothetical protein